MVLFHFQGLAKMEMRVSARLLDGLAGVALLKIAEFNPQNLANSIWVSRGGTASPLCGSAPATCRCRRRHSCSCHCCWSRWHKLLEGFVRLF